MAAKITVDVTTRTNLLSRTTDWRQTLAYRQFSPRHNPHREAFQAEQVPIEISLTTRAHTADTTYTMDWEGETIGAIVSAERWAMVRQGGLHHGPSLFS